MLVFCYNFICANTVGSFEIIIYKWTFYFIHYRTKVWYGHTHWLFTLQLLFRFFFLYQEENLQSSNAGWNWMWLQWELFFQFCCFINLIKSDSPSELKSATDKNWAKYKACYFTIICDLISRLIVNFSNYSETMAENLQFDGFAYLPNTF